MIERGLEENPTAQDEGQPFIPKDWAAMKPLLGPYKKFVERCPRFRVVQGDLPAKFTVHLAEGGAGAATGRPDWERGLQKAWMSYCRAVPREKRSAEEFARAATAAAAVAPGLGEKRAGKRPPRA